MPKYESGSAKDISNSMKGKGLQKLKYYCEMCKKQCRDDNAFKCHMTSETHLRQMRLFAENHELYINMYSRDFEKDFLDILKRKYFSKKIFANKVYTEMIANKDHTHMSSTKWTTLTGFIQYLEQTGKVIAEYTDKGPFIEFIDRSPEAIAKRAEIENRAKQENKEKKIEIKLVEKYTENIKKLNNQLETGIIENIEKKDEDLDKKEIERNKLEINIKSSNYNDKNIINPFLITSLKNSNNKLPIINNHERINDIDKLLSEIKSTKKVHKESNELNINVPLQIKKEFSWILPEIIVKIKDKELENGKLYNKKAIIISIHQEYVAKIKLIDHDLIFLIDQKFLETVIPKIGGEVIILKEGDYFRKKANLTKIQMEKYSAELKISETEEIIELPYQYFSKFSKLT